MTQDLPSFTYTYDDQHNKVYDDPNVQKVYVQLNRLADFVSSCQTKSELEYANISQNISVAPNAPIKTTADYLIDLLKFCFEKIADVEFPYFGTMGGKVISYLLVGLVDKWTEKELRPDTLQDTYNVVWDGIKAIFDTTKLQVDNWHENMEDYWFKEYTYDNKTATISQLSDIDWLPLKNDTLFDEACIVIADKSRYMMTMKMLPSKWTFKYIDSDNVWDKFYTRWNDGYAWDGPHWQNDKSCPNGTTGWQNYFKYWMGPLEHYFFYYEGGQPAYSDRPAKPYTFFHGPKNPVTNFGDDYNTDSYEHNWFTDDVKWVGWRFDRYELQDINGGTAPESLTTFLFRDDCRGQETNDKGLTTRLDVFDNWNIKTRRYSFEKLNIKKLVFVVDRFAKKIFKKIFSCKCCS